MPPPEQSLRPLILWIDDERFALTNYKALLERERFRVQCAYSFADGLDLLRTHGTEARLAIIDIMLPIGESQNVGPTDVELAKAGYEAGFVLINRAREWFAQLPLLVYSNASDYKTIDWLQQQNIRFVPKTTYFATPFQFISLIRSTIGMQTKADLPRPFIVHGHDDAAKWELKNYLQNVIGLPEPVILNERPSRGRTIIEKFEDEAADRNLVFVLLTPDDTSDLNRRARQNVIYELGYFVGKLKRETGRVLLLYKAGVELPSDLSGLIYIDISNGVEAAGEAIRRELKDLMTAS